MRQKLLLLIFLLTTLISSISAQTNNPANIILTGTGRYSLKLSDYATSSPSMLTMTLTVSDATIRNMPVKFMLTISNANYKFTTKLSNVRPITIHGGQTYVLYCSDLAEYFNPNNINFNGYKYQSIGQLPEGNNKLQVYLINQITGKRISNIASLNMYATLASAPVLRKPANNSTFESASQNPTINFEWKQPSNSYSINTKYKFQLFEIHNDNISLNTIAESINPFYESEVNNTPYFNLNTVLLNLKIGQKYAWRVIASDVNEIQKFKNDGKSEIFTFQYLTPPIPVNGLSVKVVNRNMNFSWEANQNQSSFDVEYYDYQTERTISGNIPENRIQLTAPKSDYKIKFRVRAICYGDEKRKSDWTNWLEAQVAKAPERDTNFVCGKVFPDREITNLELKTVFQEGEILESKNGDTRYEMVGVSENNNGVLSGQFYMIMDCWGGAKILCDFTDTKINTDNIVLTTRFSNHPFPDYVVDPDDIKNYVKDLWLNGNSLATSTKIRDTIVIKEKFDYLYANENGNIMAVLVNPDGSVTESVVDFYKSPTQCLVTDGKGDSLIVTNDNKIMGISEYRATGGNKALLNEYHRKKDSAAVWYVNFLPYPKQEYSFDYLASSDHGIFATDEYYPKSGNYDFRYKSVATSTTDRVIVDFGFYPEKDSVIFKDKYGVKLKLSKGNILTFTATSTADTNYIYAYDKNDVKIGKLTVKTYAKKTINLTLVRVNNSTCPKIKDIQSHLNKVYKCANVEFKVSSQEFSIPELKTFSHGGSKWTSVYNADQQKVLEAYDSRMQDDNYYLFFVDNVKNKYDSLGTAVAGYMPRGYNAGFIYEGGSPRTIAHEIGHGAFALEHVFRNSSNSGKTKNLMDYSTGEELWHFQWDNCQDPKRVWMKWKKDESEGEAYRNNTHYTCIKKDVIDKLSKYRYFYLPDGTIADFEGMRPSGFYTANDGTAKTSYGAVATVKNSDNRDLYFIFDSITKENIGYGYHTIGQGNTVVYNIKQVAEKVEAVRVLIDNNKVRIVDGKENDVIENATCKCNMAKYKMFSEEDMLTSDERHAWLYDKDNDILILVTGNFAGNISRGPKLHLNIDSLKQAGASVKEMTLNEFAKSEYNFLKKDVQKTMNEAGTYVAVRMGVSVGLPLLFEVGGVEALKDLLAWIAKQYGKEAVRKFVWGFTFQLGTDCIGNELIWELELYDKFKYSTKSDLYNWAELLSDAIMAGLSSVWGRPIWKQAVIDGVISVDCLDLCQTLLSKESDNSNENKINSIKTQTYKFCIGALCSIALSDKTPVKIANVLNKIYLKPSFIYSKLRGAFSDADASILALFIHNKGIPSSLNLKGYDNVVHFLAKSNLNLKKITQKRIESIDKLLKNLSSFKDAEQKLVNIVDVANNPFGVLSILNSHPNNSRYQMELLDSFVSLWNNSNKTQVNKHWQKLTGEYKKYKIFHCTKKGKPCTLCLIDNEVIEFVDLGKGVAVSEIGNILKSDNPESFEDFLKKSIYDNIVEIEEEF